MKPVFFSFKSINISWFMAILICSILVSYALLGLMTRKDKKYREKLEDIYFWTVVFSLLSARLIYVIFNFEVFKQNPMSIIKLSHYNLSLIGGVLGGLITLFILSRKYKIRFTKLLDIFSILFYIAMAIGVWNFKFDIFLLKLNNLSMINLKIKTMSVLFLFMGLVQTTICRKWKNSYLSSVILILTLGIYYLIKSNLIF